MKTNFILGFIILLLSIYVFLLHIDHRTLINSHNNLGRDSTYHTYAFQSLNALGRPDWGLERLGGQWIPLLSKKDLVVKPNGQVLIGAGSSKISSVMKTIYFDLQEITKIKVSTGVLNGMEKKGLVVELKYMTKVGSKHILKNSSSSVFYNKTGEAVFELDNIDAIWGYLELKILNEGEKENQILLANLPNISFDN